MKRIDFLQSVLLFLCLLGTSCAARNPYLGKDTADVIAALHSPQAQDRKDAADALKARGTEAESAIPALVEVLFDPEKNVRLAARDALIAIGPKAVEPLLEACYRAGKEQSASDITSTICDGLHLFGTNAILAFVEIYNQHDVGSSERFAVVSGLDSMIERSGERAVAAASTLVSALGDPQTQIIASRALTKLGKSAVPELIKGLSSRNRDIRYYSAVTLGRIGPEAQEAESALIQTLGDPVADVRAAAQLALEQIDSSVEYTPSQSQRIQDLIATLRDPNPVIRATAAEELGKLGPEAEDALPALWQALQDPDPDVRAAAEEAIKKIQASQ